MTKSQLFTAYNKARVSPRVDRQRVNRALGIIQKCQWLELTDEAHTFIMQSADGTTAYHVNGTCDCPDYQYRTLWCKHRIARAMILYCQKLERS